MLCFKLTSVILEHDLWFVCFVNTLALFSNSGKKKTLGGKC